MFDHSFNPFIAKKYGVNEAILINTFIFWTRTNSAKECNFHEGRYWVFGTSAYFAKYYPYFTARQIKYALANLFKSGALLKGRFNKNAYDKTNWYSLSDNLLNELNLDKTCLNPASHLSPIIEPLIKQTESENEQENATTRASKDESKSVNQLTQFSQPIPVSKTISKTNTTKGKGDESPDDPISTLKKYEITTPRKITSVHKAYIQKAVDLLSTENLTLHDYLKYLTEKCSRALLPYHSNGKERQNGFGNILRESFVRDVLDSKWED
jgi:hypothetical protein